MGAISLAAALLASSASGQIPTPPPPAPAFVQSAGQTPKAKAAYAPNCAAPRDADEANYCQGNKALQVAAEANSIASQNRLLTFLGLLGLLATLFYTARAAIAASRSAEIAKAALEGIERPFLVLEFIKADGDEPLFDHHKEFAEIKFRFRNHGKTPAIITYLRREAVPHDIAAPPPEPPKPGRGEGFPLPHGVVVGAGQHSQEFISFPLEQVTAQLTPVDPQRSWFFLGYVRYKDLLGQEFIAGFCTWRHLPGHDFYAANPLGRGDSYNYDRRAERADIEPVELPGT